MSEFECAVFGAVVDASNVRRPVTITRAERAAAGRTVSDYVLTVAGEIRGRFAYDGGLYRLLDAAGREVAGVPVALHANEFEGRAQGAFARGLLPPLAQALSGLMAGARQPDETEVARVAHRLDNLVFRVRGTASDSDAIGEADGVTLGEIRAVLAGYAACKRALTITV